MVTARATSAASPSAPLVLWEATPLPWHPWSEVPQCLPAPEGRHFLMLPDDPTAATSPPPSPASMAGESLLDQSGIKCH